MVVGNLQYPGLGHYLRLVSATPQEWLAGMAYFAGGRQLTLCVRPQGFNGAISWLARPGVSIGVIGTGVETTLRGTNTADPAVIGVLTGSLSLTSANGYVEATAASGFLLPPHARVEFNGSPGLTLAVARLHGRGGASWGDEARPISQSLVAQIIGYLQRAYFFRSYHHAVAETDRLGNVLWHCLHDPRAELPVTPPSVMPGFDQRVTRMIELIASSTEREFDIGRVSAMAGVSTRNLYYLMKKHTGMSPYQFFVSRRLVRVRRALLDCQCDVPTVSWHALSEGFSHLGRFSALYRNHFGEYPRQTLEWRSDAQARAAAIQPADCSATPRMLCLTTG